MPDTCETCQQPILLRREGRTQCARCETAAGLDPYRWARDT